MQAHINHIISLHSSHANFLHSSPYLQSYITCKWTITIHANYVTVITELHIIGKTALQINSRRIYAEQSMQMNSLITWVFLRYMIQTYSHSAAIYLLDECLCQTLSQPTKHWAYEQPIVTLCVRIARAWRSMLTKRYPLSMDTIKNNSIVDKRREFLQCVVRCLLYIANICLFVCVVCCMMFFLPSLSRLSKDIQFPQCYIIWWNYNGVDDPKRHTVACIIWITSNG